MRRSGPFIGDHARHKLNKNGGQFSEENQQKLFTKVCERYQPSGKIPLADREFIGEKWLAFLVWRKIDFIIRMSMTLGWQFHILGKDIQLSKLRFGL